MDVTGQVFFCGINKFSVEILKKFDLWKLCSYKQTNEASYAMD